MAKAKNITRRISKSSTASQRRRRETKPSRLRRQDAAPIPGANIKRKPHMTRHETLSPETATKLHEAPSLVPKRNQNTGGDHRRSRASKAITKLYAEFELAHRDMQAIPPVKSVKDDTKPFERAVDRCSRIAWKIVKAPARTLNEMLIKIRIAGWCAGAMKPNYQLADLDDWQPTPLCNSEELHALVTLREDIREIGSLGLTSIGYPAKTKIKTSQTTCPVERFALESSYLCARYDWTDNQQATPTLEREKGEISDRRKALADQISFLVPKSATGAALQLVLASVEADDLANSAFPIESMGEEIQRRMNRLLYGVARYLKTAGAKLDPIVWQYHMSDELDHHTTIAEREAREAKPS